MQRQTGNRSMQPANSGKVCTMDQLRAELRSINHKPYGMYKQLQGNGYDFKDFILWIDHVQGDPFAAPSRIRLELLTVSHGFSQALWNSRETKTALEDYVLRGFLRSLRANEDTRAGSGKSGNLSSCRVGQEVLERIAVLFGKKSLEVRMEAGFPARGRSILSEELEIIFFEILPRVVKESLQYRSLDSAAILANKELAENQAAIREYLKEYKLAAFVANDSMLARESGISDRPMKNGVAFQSPKELEITIAVPHGKALSGMGIPHGITVITGGGYHGKSTLLKALESGVYNHIAGDGREYVITRDDAVKLRSEDGRGVFGCNISSFINHLPNKQDTVRFSTENASGSTSQAANVIEALEAGSRLFLIDEDTTATNFMIRDSLMSRLVTDDEEPITPFIRKVRSLYEDCGVSTIIVAGSCGEYLAEADTVLRLNNYRVEDVTKRAKELTKEAGIAPTRERFEMMEFNSAYNRRIEPDYKYHDFKIKTNGTDTLIINQETIDVRYMEQIKDGGQCIALGMLMRDIFMDPSNRGKTKQQLVEAVYRKVEEKGLLSITPKGYSCGHPVMPRKQELYGCLGRLRGGA